MSPPADAADRADVSETATMPMRTSPPAPPPSRRIAAQDKAWQRQRGCRGGRTLQELPACCSLHGLAGGLRWISASATILLPQGRKFKLPKKSDNQTDS